MRRVLTAIALGVLTALVIASPATAHDDEGVWELVSAQQAPSDAEPGAIDLAVEARLTYVNDGHPAEDTGTVTFIAEGAGGVTVGPVIVPATDGLYAATLVLPEPGAWTLRLNALAPLATLDVPIEVLALPTAVPSTVTSDPPRDDPRPVRILRGPPTLRPAPSPMRPRRMRR